MFDKLAEKMKAKNRIMNEEEIEFKNLEEATEATFERPMPEEDEPVSAPSSIEGSNIELKVVRPESFEEVSTIADYLLDGCTVFLSFESMEPAQARRMIDFLNGVTYSTGGDIKAGATNSYILTPHNVNISDEN